VAAFGFFLGLANAKAQEGVTFQAFQGSIFILDNPTSATCQAHNVNFGDIYGVVYRFSLNPSVVADALSIIGFRGVSQMYSTQSPGFSLNGASTTNWNYINRYASFGSLSPSSSNLTILSGLNLPVSSATGNLKILGSINDFDAISGCNIAQVHAALVASPN
jgi:hypothetical protein